VIKTRKLYQVRREIGDGSSSRQVGHKMRLLSRSCAQRVAKYLRQRGVDAFLVPVTVAALPL
jgi:hypothetical protein